MAQADDAEAEAAKRETLGAALAAFVAAVRRDRSPVREGTATPTAAELLGPEGKLGLSHILPIYKECAAELVRGLESLNHSNPSCVRDAFQKCELSGQVTFLDVTVPAHHARARLGF